MNLLPLNWNFNVPECLKNRSGMTYCRIYETILNRIPTFQSPFVAEDIYVISVKLCKVNEIQLKFNNIVHDEITILTTPFISVAKKTINEVIHSALYNKEKFFDNQFVSKKGTYQLKIETHTGNLLFSDLFFLNGDILAQYSCSNANFDVPTNVFSIDITRTDTNVSAISQTSLTLRYYNSSTGLYVGQTTTNFSLNIGQTTTLTFPISGITVPFDFFRWVGACQNELEISLLSFENNYAFQMESSYFLLLEN